METYFSNLTAADGSAEKLVRDVRVLMRDTEELLRNSCEVLGEQTRMTARHAKRAVRQYPYASFGAALAAGFLAGLLLTRK